MRQESQDHPSNQCLCVMNAGKLYESGCTKFYHCEGGAICIDRRCVCPTGYTGSSSGDHTKCVKRDGKPKFLSATSCVKKVGEGSYSFPTDSRKFPTEKLVFMKITKDSHVEFPYGMRRKIIFEINSNSTSVCIKKLHFKMQLYSAQSSYRFSEFEDENSLSVDSFSKNVFLERKFPIG